MSDEFKDQDRVRVAKQNSTYFKECGTVVGTDSFGHKVLIDGMSRPLRFLSKELEAAPALSSPELARTQAYLRELDEDTKQLLDTVSLYPQGTSVQKDMQAFANHQAKIIYNLKLVLSQDGVTLWEAEDGGK